MPRYSDWPLWLQVLVVPPYGLLLSAALWLWWPKSDKDRKTFGIVIAYLLFFVGGHALRLSLLKTVSGPIRPIPALSAWEVAYSDKWFSAVV